MRSDRGFVLVRSIWLSVDVTLACLAIHIDLFPPSIYSYRANDGSDARGVQALFAAALATADDATVDP